MSILQLRDPNTGKFIPLSCLVGPKGDDGVTPVKGTDYFTEADKAEIVSAVIAALPVYAGEVI